MMRLLLPLALLGAAPAPADITAAATCALPREATMAAFKALPLVSTEDDTEADERGTISLFRDGAVWGTPAKFVKISDYANPKEGSTTLTFETGLDMNYADARDRLLAAHGKTACDKSYANSCDIFFPDEGKWQKAIMVEGSGGAPGVRLTCIFSIPAQTK